jgi:acetate kinase
VTAVVRTLLAINAGSSTIKCALFAAEDSPRCLVRETLQGAGAAVLPRLVDWIAGHADRATLVAIGHRVVHGGRFYSEPQRIDDAVIATLGSLVPLAPNHLPDEIVIIEALRREYPDAVHIACFDTAFHRDLPEVAARIPIPPRYEEQGVRRYGFHGLSYTFLMRELRRLDERSANGRVILAHLGNGASLAAVRGGRSIDTTMAFTPIGGVPMSTRSGDLDPGIVAFIARTDQLTADAIEDVLSHHSGLAAVSGGPSDMRELLERAPHDQACRTAVDLFAYQVKKAIGAFAAALGGLDVLVFAGGIGEHAPEVRAGIVSGLDQIGLRLDPVSNSTNNPVISAPGSLVTVRIIPTDEELMIAISAGALATRGDR